MAEFKKTLIPNRGSVQLRLPRWYYVPDEALLVSCIPFTVNVKDIPNCKGLNHFVKCKKIPMMI